MVNLISQVPDELVSSLEGIASHRRMSIQQLAVDRLRSLLVTGGTESRPGSAQALLRVIGEPPLSSADVDELDAVIAAGPNPVRTADLF